MPGRHITDCQTRLYMKSRQSNVPAIAAAKAGFSTATAYRIEADPRLPAQKKKPRGRRRPDPLAGVWDSEIGANAGDRPRHPRGGRLRGDLPSTSRDRPGSAPDLGAPHRRMAGSQRSRPGCDLPPGASAGPHGPVRLHRPGRAWHHDRERAVRSPAHHFRLAFSGFEHAHVVLGGESFVALAEGLQDALWALGGVPEQHRSDSLSAAFCNRSGGTGGPHPAPRSCAPITA